MSRARLILCVLLPFAAGYYLSYLFRTINALIAADLTAEFNLSAGDLGFLTSVYFLVFAAAQLPLGALLDRYGPATIHSALLLLASAGALVFALADGLIGLLVGRVFVAVGVALALMAGFKAILIWFPADSTAAVNGWLVMLGALGAVTATGPAEVLVHAMGWRGLFVVLAGLSAIAALLIVSAVPEPKAGRPGRSHAKHASLWAAYRDRRLWRIAPLSATGIAASWSLQGLWAAPWLRDVEQLDRSDVVQHLTIMALAVCLSALLLGALAGRLRRIGVKTEWVLASTLMASMAAQAALVLRCPFPSLLLWPVIAAAGAATVLSFTILGEYFPKEISGRANAALNLLHLGCAFILQSATGLIISQWPESHGTHPAEAHELAMAATLALQVAALGWFACSPLRLPIPEFARALRHFVTLTRSRPAMRTMPYIRSRLAWAQHTELVRMQTAGWRFAATTSAMLTLALTVAIFITMSRPAVAIHIVEAGPTAEGTPNPHQTSIAGPIGDPVLTQAAVFPTDWSWAPPDGRGAFLAGTPMFRIWQSPMTTDVSGAR
jgi:MFS family permease